MNLKKEADWFRASFFILGSLNRKNIFRLLSIQFFVKKHQFCLLRIDKQKKINELKVIN